MSLRSANFATPPVLTQDSQGPQTVERFRPLSADQFLCIGPLTTNTPFSDWGNILFNTTIATAIADRLVENSEIFLLGGDSLRKANKHPDPPAE